MLLLSHCTFTKAGCAGGQIPLVRSSAWPLLLLDRITLPDCEAECCEEGAEAVGAPVRLFRDPAMPDRVLCCTTRRAFSVTLPWIPILASCLAEGVPNKSLQLPGSDHMGLTEGWRCCAPSCWLAAGCRR